MTIESTNDQLPTTPAITYSECYRLPFLSLFHADCMKIMKQYPDKYFDLAIVDPPYGINMSNYKRNGNIKFDMNKSWDSLIPTEQYFVELNRVSKNQIIWGGNYFTDFLPPTKGWIFWNKKQNGNLQIGEMAYTSMDRMKYFERIWQLDRNWQEEKIHPTEKPKEVYSFCLKEFATEGMKLLDTHFGSGSIALAVDKANRLDKMNLHLTAFEIDKEYIDKAIKRISESIKQGTLSF